MFSIKIQILQPMPTLACLADKFGPNPSNFPQKYCQPQSVIKPHSTAYDEEILRQLVHNSIREQIELLISLISGDIFPKICLLGGDAS